MKFTRYGLVNLKATEISYLSAVIGEKAGEFAIAFEILQQKSPVVIPMLKAGCFEASLTDW